MWLNSILINSSLKIEVVGEEKIDRLHGEGKKIIFAFWHRATFCMFYYYRRKKNCVFPVDNYLGSILAGFVKRYGIKAIRYPERGTPIERTQAVIKLIRTIKEGYDCSIAVDGPPDEKLFNVKPGVFYLAQRTGSPVIPIGVYYKRAFVFKFRWDKYLMPKPFTRAVLYVGEPIHVKKELSEMDTKKMCDSLEEKLHELTRKAKEVCLSK
jgi:lysophospholipid acyltransferase (LPLAT)-like uncharacterized protein